MDFYLSISKKVLIDRINYAKNYVEITDEQYQIILTCRKTVLKNNDCIPFPVQNGNSSVQNGKIIINIKKLQRDNMGVQL